MINILLFGSGFFGNGFLYNLGSFSCGFSGFVAAHAAALTTGSGTFGSLGFGSLAVGFLDFVFLEAFGDGSGESTGDKLDALGCIIVGGNHVVDSVGVAVGVDHTDYGNTQTVGFGNCDTFFEHVDYEESGGQTVEVGDGTESFLEFGTLTGDLEAFALGEVVERSILAHFVDCGHLPHGLADGGEVGEHTTGPALDYVGHAYRSGEVGDYLLGLLFSGYKQDFLPCFAMPRSTLAASASLASVL